MSCQKYRNAFWVFQMKIESYGNRELMHMGKLELHTGEVHIWKLRWRELETFWEWHKPLLEKEEYQKVKHYHFYEDQMRYLTGKIAVRMLLKEYSGVDKIVLRKGKYGKLYWKAPPGQKEITFREERKKAKEYWSARLKNLPQGPDMPLAKRPEEVKNLFYFQDIMKQI